MKITDNNMRRRLRKSFSFSLILIILGFLTLTLLMCFSVTKGSTDIPLSTIFDTIFRFDRYNSQHLVVWNLRIPRVLTSALIGGALAVAGAIIQGITENPLSDPGIMGINAGAGFTLACSFAFFPELGYMKVLLVSFMGAALGMILVNTISRVSQGEFDSFQIVLSGIAVNMVLVALSQGIAIVFNVSQNIMFWTMGGVVNVSWQQVKIILPFIVISFIFSILLSKKLTILSLGKNISKSLGVNNEILYVALSTIILVLSGISVSLVGSIGFVGLMVPHIVRFLVGTDYRKIIPVSIILGGNLMVLADLGSKTINPPFETPIGIIISSIGVPFFLYLVDRERRRLE